MKGYWVLAMAACFALAASPVAGQSDTATYAHIIACMRAHPEHASAPVVVYAYAHVDSTQEQAAAVWIAAENLLQPVADAMARLLGSKPGVLPIADSTIPWYTTKADVYVEAYRDGRVAFRTDPSRAPSTTERFLEEAIDSVVARESSPLVIAPDGTSPPDRASFHILTSHGASGVDGITVPISMRYEGVAVPMFATRFPTSTQVGGPMDFVQPQLPKNVKPPVGTGTVIERFVVDSDGRAVPSTIQDIWPHGRSMLTGDETNYWDEFVRAVHNWLKQAHFKPATIGGCPVRQLVQEPFEFNIPG